MEYPECTWLDHWTGPLLSATLHCMSNLLNKISSFSKRCIEKQSVSKVFMFTWNCDLLWHLCNTEPQLAVEKNEGKPVYCSNTETVIHIAGWLTDFDIKHSALHLCRVEKVMVKPLPWAPFQSILISRFCRQDILEVQKITKRLQKCTIDGKSISQLLDSHCNGKHTRVLYSHMEHEAIKLQTHDLLLFMDTNSDLPVWDIKGKKQSVAKSRKGSLSLPPFLSLFGLKVHNPTGHACWGFLVL